MTTAHTTSEDQPDHIGDAVTGGAWTGLAPIANLAEEQADQIDTTDELIEALRDSDTAVYEERFTATVQAEFARRRSSNPGTIPDHLSVAVRFVGYAAADELTDSWSESLASQLYQHARENTPLPGSDTAPDWTTGKTPGAALLAAGHWPHLRIRELAHYDTPGTDTRTEN